MARKKCSLLTSKAWAKVWRDFWPQAEVRDVDQMTIEEQRAHGRWVLEGERNWRAANWIERIDVWWNGTHLQFRHLDLQTTIILFEGQPYLSDVKSLSEAS